MSPLFRGMPASARPMGASAPGGILLTVCLGNLLMPLNTTMIYVALPDIRQEFSVGVSTVVWLMTGYLVVMATGQVVGGKLADAYGRSRLFSFGLLSFGVFSLLAALAWDFPSLVLFRICQALGGSLMVPSGFAIVREAFPDARRGGAFGILGASIMLTAALGPVVGGVAVGLGGWQAIFYLNLPVVIVAWLLAQRLLPPSSRPGKLPGGFDYPGVALLAAALFALVYFLSVLRDGNVLLAAPVSGAAGVLVALAFVRREMSLASPGVELRLFQSKAFTASAVCAFFSYMAMYALPFLLAVYLQEVQGRGAVQTGEVLLALFVTALFTATLGGRLADRWGRRTPVMLGIGIMLLGLVPLLALGADTPLWVIVLALVVEGLGTGVTQAGVNVAGVEAVPGPRAATAAGMASTARVIGGMVGAGVLGVVLGPGEGAPPVAAVRGEVIFLMAMTGLGLLAARFIHVRPPQEPEAIRPAEAQRVPAGGTVGAADAHEASHGYKPPRVGEGV